MEVRKHLHECGPVLQFLFSAHATLFEDANNLAPHRRPALRREPVYRGIRDARFPASGAGERCRGRARGQGRTGRTQRRSQLKARWPVDRDKTLSRFCPAWKSKNFVSRARNTPLRSVFLSAWEAKVSWSCSARPASLGFPERSGVLPAPEIPGSVSKPKGTPRKYQSGPSSWAATASGEGGDSNGSCQRGGDYRCEVRGGDLDLLPVAGIRPGNAGIPAAPGTLGTIAQGRLRDQSPVDQFLELG